VDTSPELEDFISRLAPQTPEEQVMELLNYAAAMTAPDERTTLAELCDYVRRTVPDARMQQTLVEIIEGRIALREIAEG
jgi:hypothetical protein